MNGSTTHRVSCIWNLGGRPLWPLLPFHQSHLSSILKPSSSGVLPISVSRPLASQCCPLSAGRRPTPSPVHPLTGRLVSGLHVPSPLSKQRCPPVMPQRSYRRARMMSSSTPKTTRKRPLHSSQHAAQIPLVCVCVKVRKGEAPSYRTSVVWSQTARGQS